MSKGIWLCMVMRNKDKILFLRECIFFVNGFFISLKNKEVRL